MGVLATQSEFGHAPPPQTPYSIISNLPGWDLAKGVRDGNKAPLARIVHIYPRFMPTHYVAKLGQEVTKFLGMEGNACLLYLDPGMWPYTKHHVTHDDRGLHRITEQQITLKCVEIAGHRVFAVFFKPENMPALSLTWGNAGTGISIRGGEELLKGVDSMKEVEFEGGNVPTPTWTPESPAHQGIRERVVELLRHAPIDPEKVKCEPRDVFLYPTGMAAIFNFNNLLLKYRPGTLVVLGIVFHNTYHHLIEECPHGWKHFGKVDKQAIDEFEGWLDEEARAGRQVSYVLIEIPGNPTLDSPDLTRLKKLSEKHGFVFIVDETVSGFGNVDVLTQSDFITTSLTKSFSGEANVMAGSVVLNPLSPHYNSLSSIFSSSHHNELFAADAEVLLENSKGFFPRTRKLNSNAAAMAKFFHECTSKPDSPIVNVQYPSLLPSKPQYDAYLRPSSAELPEPGYGCLFTVEFDSVENAVAFYDRCGFYPSPHLAGHVTLMFPYNMFVFCKKAEEKEYMSELGVREESIRFSAGLEDEQDLIDTIKDALDYVIGLKKKKNAGEPN